MKRFFLAILADGGRGPLSSWVSHRRPTGAPAMTYGRSVFKALGKFNLDVARWPELAAKRGAWREMARCCADGPCPTHLPPTAVAADAAANLTHEAHAGLCGGDQRRHRRHAPPGEDGDVRAHQLAVNARDGARKRGMRMDG